MNKKYIIIGVVLISLVLVGFMIAIITNPVYKYSREAIKVLENYKDRDITIVDCAKELRSISYTVKQKSEEEENTNISIKLNLLSTKISLISTKIEVDKPNNIEINEYIKEIKDL